MTGMVSVDKSELIDRIYAAKMVVSALVTDVKEVRENAMLTELGDSAQECLCMMYEYAAKEDEELEG